MRFKFLAFLLFSAGLSLFSQAPMDGPFVSERFQVYNGLINYKVWGIGDFLVMNADRFELDGDDIAFIQTNNIKQFEANYLFQEESHWLKRLYRTILFGSHEANEGAESVVVDGVKSSFSDFLESNKNNPNLFYYRTQSFNITLSESDIVKEDYSKVVGVVFKEDWAYNKMKNQVDVYISGVAPIVKEASGYRELFWMSFLNLKGELNALNAKSGLLNKLQDRRFKASVDKVQNIVMIGVEDHSYQNDLDALVELMLLEEKISLTPDVYRKEGPFKIKVDDFVIKGNIKQNVLDGKITLKHKDLGLLLEVNYVAGKPNGSYKKYYSKGLVQHEGLFQGGLREGEWKSFYEDGKVASVRNYVAGFMDGVQKLYYSNGQIRNEYSFEDRVLNGDFKSFYSDGTMKESGFVARGLITGEWSYNIKVLPRYLSMIQRNESYWNSSFKIEKSWNTSVLNDGVITMKVKYSQVPGDNCLNKLCPNMEVVSSK